MLNQTIFSPQRQKLILYIALIVVTLAVYWQVNHYDFVNFDDNVYVTENHHIQSGITMDGFRWSFSAPAKNYAGLWTPLLWLSFMLDNQIYGMNAGGYHLTNLILHILSSLLLFWLFNRMTGAVWKSAFVAAVFALHPLHVESVAWVTERKDVLSAFFWMLTLCLYVYYTETPAIKRYLLVLFGFVLALMSKPMVITLPVVMILLDYWPLKRFESNKDKIFLWQLKEKTPFFILSAVIFVVTLTGQEPDWEHFPFFLRLVNGPVAFVTYLEKTFWPHDMAVFYPFPAHIPLWQVSGATLLIIAISIAVIVMAKRLPYLFVGWMWFTITIFPVTGIIYQIWLCAMTDRYHYIPSIGLTVMMAWGIPLLSPRQDMRKMILFPMGILFIGILSFLTWKQCGYWKNSNTLFSYALQVTQDSFVAHNNLGLALVAEGKIDEAIGHYNEALRIKPRDPQSLNNRGIAFSKIDQHQNAIRDYNKVISINPNIADAYYNRGLAYTNTGQYQQAIADYNKSISLNPDYVEVYNNRGFIYLKFGQYQRAIDDYNEVIRLMPNHANAYNNRAFVYLNMGNMESGCNDARRACALGVCATLEAAKGQGYCR